jgi:hypothetical protein
MAVTSGSRPADLVGWLDRHRHLDEALALARRVAPQADDAWDQALRALDAALRLHMAQEERRLLPAYEPLAASLPSNAAPRVLRADHDRLRALLDAATTSDPLARADALSLLAGALEHHHLREARYFKPTLDAGIDAATRRAWLQEITDEEEALGPLPSVPVRASRAVPGEEADPLRAFALAVALDARLAERWARVPVPDHPKGARHHEACAALSAVVEAAPDLPTRRDRLAALSDRLRLLRVISAGGSAARRG